MLSSFARHFNETVFRGPDGVDGGGNVEDVLDTGGVAGADGDDASGTDGDAGDGEVESQKPLSVREQLKASIEEVRADEEGKTKAPKKDAKTGKFQAAPKPGEAPPQEEPPAPAAVAAPADLPPEAKAEWDKTPPAMQAAFIKRGQDMAAGVEQLKQRYNLIDQAIAPHTDALRQMNATPADAVNRMFLWFKALAGSPAQSFPALAKSMGIDWTKLAGPPASAAPNAAAAAPTVTDGGAPPVTEIPAPVKEYIGNLEEQLKQLSGVVNQIGGQFGNMQQSFQTQSEAKTRENLNIWAKDKPHFESVRQDMAKLIETQVVPLKENGEVDLDTAYERAIYFNPEVRKKVLAEQQQADLAVRQQTQDAATTAQQTQVGKARKAAVSLPASSTPGAQQGNRAAAAKKPGQKTPVRDSLRQAIQQLRDQ